MRLRTSIPPWLLFFAALPLLAQEEAKPAAKADPKAVEAAEARLLEAELLEVSAGELEKAMAAYRAVRDDAALPGALRARALLCLGRCQRKLGRLEEARQLLEEIAVKHPEETDLVRQARSFLRELQSGKAENRDFDWLRELERSPEIQARVFDLAMKLTTTPGTDDHKSARRQLVALGPIAAPVLEKMVETTRDAGHRRELAVVLCQLGRFEHLPKLLSTEQPPAHGTASGQSFASFCSAIPSLSQDERSRLLEAAAKVPEDPAIRKEKFLLRLWASDAKAIESLADYEADFEKAGGMGSIVGHLAESPAGAAALAARILDPRLTQRTRRGYYERLFEKRPEALSLAHFEMLLGEALAEDRSHIVEYVNWLDQHKGHDVFLKLLDSAVAEEARYYLPVQLREYFEKRHLKQPGAADPAWSNVLRRVDVRMLIYAAARADAAIPALIEFLESGEALPNDTTGGDQKLSSAYRDAMAKLLASTKPAAQAFALEALAREPAELTPALFERFLELAGEPADLHVREFALHAALRGLEKFPERVKDVARAAAGEFDRRALKEMPEAYREPPLGETAQIGLAVRRHLQPQPRRQPRRPDWTESLGWLFHDRAAIVSEGLDAIYPHVFDLANAGEAVPFHEWYLGRPTTQDVQRRFVSRLSEVRDHGLMESIILRIGVPGGREPMELETRDAFIRRALNDRGLALEVRWQLILRYGEPWNRFEDLPSFFKGDDPLLAKLFDGRDQKALAKRAELWSWLEHQDAAPRLAVLQSALRCPLDGARIDAARLLPLDLEKTRALFEAAFKDPSDSVRWSAAKRLAQSTRADVAPTFHQLLGDGSADVRLACVGALLGIASQESLEPLGKLLDDPDIRVREKAFEALKTIRSRLEEKGEWQRIIAGLKAAKPEEPVPVEKAEKKSELEKSEETDAAPPAEKAEKPADPESPDAPQPPDNAKKQDEPRLSRSDN